MNKVNGLNFEGETLFCGLDVHKTNWKVHLRLGDRELASFSQNPDPALLIAYFSKNYPGAKVEVVYEAGFCGFSAQRSLTAAGIACMVVNPADVPTSDKEHKRKDDRRDARKLCRELADGNSLTGIYIPTMEMEQARSLVRERFRLVKDQTRCKNRIKHLLMFSGLKVGNIDARSQKYVKHLQELSCPTVSLRTALDLAIAEYLQIRKLLKDALLALRALSQEPAFQQVQPYLQSIEGIGLITGLLIQTEIQDMRRFKDNDHLCSYVGFVPDIKSSNDKMKVRGITHRRNPLLRESIIESSWIIIRKDPAMLMKYNKYRQHMNANKAIIRIGKHLLARIRYVWLNQKKYETGLVQGCVLEA